MNRTTLKAAGELLWGPRFASDMARELDVHFKTVMRWLHGQTGIPDYAGEQLAKLLVARQREIGRMLDKIGATP
jgi:hypothetical protein